MNVTTVEGFDTFMSSLKKKTFRSHKEGCGVDLVLSCVDNYEARMVVNQVGFVIIMHFICFLKLFDVGSCIQIVQL